MEIHKKFVNPVNELGMDSMRNLSNASYSFVSSNNNLILQMKWS